MNYRLTQLPEGWKWVTLEEISSVGTGATPLKSKSEYYESGTVPWVTSGLLNELFITKTQEKITELAIKETNAKVFPKHTLLVAMYGEGKTRGKVSELLIDAATNQACAGLIFEGTSSAIRPYVKMFFQKNYDDIRRLSSGGVQPNLNLNIIKAARIPLPPLSEQRRIVVKIEELKERTQRAKEALEEIPTLLEQFRQSVLAAAFCGDLTADWREKNPNVEPASVLLERTRHENQRAKIRRGVPEEIIEPDTIANWRMQMPETWTYASTANLIRIGAIIDLKDGNHGSNHPKTSDFTLTGLPFITAAQVKNFKIDYSNAYKIAGEPLEKLKVGFAKPGDVIFTHKGSVGRVAVNTKECILTPQTTYYRVSEKVIVNYYLMWFLSSPYFAAQLDEIKSQTTRDFVPITAQYLLFHKIPPLAEQLEIVKRLESLFQTVTQVEQQYKKVQEQLSLFNQSILAKAFRGELVPQDPNDEPASVLLERIRAEREKLQTKAAKKFTPLSGGRRSKKASQQDTKSVQLEVGLE